MHDIASKFIEFYWRQVKPYKAAGSNPGVLNQNQGKQAAIPKLVLQLQSKYPTLTDAKFGKDWQQILKRVSGIILNMPLWKLQTLRRQKVIFLYQEKLTNGGVDLLQGVAFCFRKFNGFILQAARYAWMDHIKTNPLNRSLVGDDNNLASFLFETERSSLTEIREFLADIQSNKCFYCHKLIRDAGAVDHFIPWIRYPRDITQNFVLAHQRCNTDKSDLLAATIHLAHWRERNSEYERDLDVFRAASIISDMVTSLHVARWAYGNAYASKAQVWVSPKVTEELNNDFMKILA